MSVLRLFYAALVINLSHAFSQCCLNVKIRLEREIQPAEWRSFTAMVHPQSKSPSRLHVYNKFVDGRKEEDGAEINEDTSSFPVVNELDSFPKKAIDQTKTRSPSNRPTEFADICIIGGGVSGLTAAFKAAESGERNVVLLEASESLGGRVQSDKTADGFVLDRGFAVFIEEYPAAKRLLDFNKLCLGKFQPGALIKIPSRASLVRIADPLRQPGALFASLVSPVGNIFEKLSLVPLLATVKSQSIDDIFNEPETNTLDALQNRWGVGTEIMERFFSPFLEGIYLAPLKEQSSRMFMFVLKMFAEGAATLPRGGIGQVSAQLVAKAAAVGADLRTNVPATKFTQNDEGFLVESLNGKTRIQTKSVVVATDGSVAHRVISQIKGLEALETLPEIKQRVVGCLYYGFDGPPPVLDPVLLLSGSPNRGSIETPINNICFPSAVAEGYAPTGKSLCSVTILKDASLYYSGKEDELDTAVREELSEWFPESSGDIMLNWKLKGVYLIGNAQPDQLNGMFPANYNGGRLPDTFRGKQLPSGLFVCGDHVSTSTLNGALQSGETAGSAASNYLLQ